MTTGTGHPAFLNRVMGAHLEFGTGFLMALDAHCRIAVRLVRREGYALRCRRTMDLMAVATGIASLVMSTECPVHQFPVVLVATRAVRTLGHLDRRTGFEDRLNILTRIDMAALTFRVRHGSRRATLHPLVTGKALLSLGMPQQFPGADLLRLFFRRGCSLT